MTPPWIDVDYNGRNWDGLVLAGLESFTDDWAYAGQHVLAWQVEDETVADATVERVDADRRLAYLRVKWDTVRDASPTSAPSSLVSTPSQWRLLPSAIADSFALAGHAPELIS